MSKYRKGMEIISNKGFVNKLFFSFLLLSLLSNVFVMGTSSFLIQIKATKQFPF